MCKETSSNNSFKNSFIQIISVQSIYIYIYILQQYRVVTISLGRFMADQMQYNLKSAQYL